MTREQQQKVFRRWAVYDPSEQRLMIDEYIISISRDFCSKERFLNFLQDRMQTSRHGKSTKKTVSIP